MMPTRNARIIIPVWGHAFAMNVFAGASLPALLAPGNLPHLSRHFACELVILTEQTLVEPLSAHPAVAKAGEFARVRFRVIDDLLGVSDYSVPLTLALFRGMEGLGDALTATYFFFLNADFVLCDGAYRSVAERIEAGETAILAPSLRVSLESASPALLAMGRDGQIELAVPPRALVRLALDHLHPMPRAKIVNRSQRHARRIDQFYWAVNDGAIVGFQFPMALVCVRPERPPPTHPPGFFDYCALPVLAPAARPCVLADSDAFFMLELQRSRTGTDSLRPGWPSLERIAASLEEWTTAEQRALGRELLCIHAEDLGPEALPIIEEAQRYRTALEHRLVCAPQPYAGHKFWLPAHAQFVRDYRARQRRRAATGVERSTEVPLGEPGASFTPSEGARSLGFRTLEGVRGLAHRLLGSVPAVGRAHPMWLYYHAAVRDIALAAAAPGAAITFVVPLGSVFTRCLPRRGAVSVREYDGLFKTLDGVAAEFLVTPGALPTEGLLFIELGEVEAESAPHFTALLAQHIPRGCKLMVYLREDRAGILRGEAASLDQRIAAQAPPGAVGLTRFYGTALNHLAMRLTTGVIAAYYQGRTGRFLALGAAVALLEPLVFVQNTSFRRRGRTTPGRYSTAMLVKYLRPVV